MSAHTPGPWEVFHPTREFPSTISVAALGGQVHVYSAPLTRETEANACIIAAAPDLLKALRDALPFINCRECGSHNPYVEDIRDAAKAVIAKARGES